MLPRRYDALNCSIARSLEVVGDRWTVLILRNALVGQTKFEQFAASLGVASNVLTDRLTRLTDEGIVERRAYQEKPVRHEYVVTEKGRELWPVLVAFIEWGDRHHAPDGPPRLVVHAGCGGRLRQQLTCADCGEAVSTDAIETRPGPGSVVGSAS
ncbi:MAG: winged helix-turn-helix transcriptional regulator [Actinomycetota bacterium]|nr:winged helix-turn-helix transcriptional regulator [Actinomycetota bacterium]